MKILLTGKDGQVGFALHKKLASLGEVVATNRDMLDLSDPQAIRIFIDQTKPDIIINPAAYTKVDQAESEPELASQINAIAPQVLAEKASELNIPIIHFSTDYVFDGLKNEPYVETDQANPQSVYGQTKWEGEKAVHQNKKHIILRTSWVFGSHGQNFLKTMIRLAHDREVLRVVSDQQGVPTSAHLLADVSKMLVNKLNTDDRKNFPFGIYHVAPKGETNWYGYAKLVIHEAMKLGDTFNVSPEMMHAIQTKDYPTRAQRPLNSRLDASLFEKEFSMTLPPWEEGVFAIIRALYKG